jgi:hypothetical protein
VAVGVQRDLHALAVLMTTEIGSPPASPAIPWRAAASTGGGASP